MKVEIQTTALNSELWCAERADGRRSEQFCANAKNDFRELRRAVVDRARERGIPVDPLVVGYFKAAIGVLEGEDPVFPARQRPLRRFDPKSLEQGAIRLHSQQHAHALEKQKVVENPLRSMDRSDFVTKFPKLGRAAHYIFDINCATDYCMAREVAAGDRVFEVQLSRCAATAHNDRWTAAKFRERLRMIHEAAIDRQNDAR